MTLSRDRFILREYYSRTNAPELNCPFYSFFRLYKRREIHALFAAALAEVPARGTVRVLDLGCGDASDTDFALCRLTGFWKEPQAIAGLELTFAEGDPALVEVVAARIADLAEILPGFSARVRQVNLAALLPFEDGAFDIVISSEVVEHLERPEAAIGEMRRVLSAGGQLIFTTDNEPTLLGRVKRAVAKLLGRHVPGEHERFVSTGEKVPAHHVDIGGERVPVYGHINTRTAGEWERVFTQAGFDVVRHGRYDSVVRHLGEYSPFKMLVFALANAVAAALPSGLGKHLGATTLMALRKQRR